MKNKRLLNAFGEIDERHILEAVPAKRKNRRAVWMKYAATAACLCLVLTGIFGVAHRTVLGEPVPPTREPSESEPAYNNTEPDTNSGITESDVPSEPVDNQSETDEEKNAPSDPVRNNSEVNSTKDVFTINNYYAKPNYEAQLAQSEDVILGEVIEELDGYYCNPDNEIKELDNMWITPYVVRVDESYRGVYSKGDEVIVTAWNYFAPGEEHPDVVIINEREFYLHEGQRAVFMLNDCSEYLSIDGWDKVYEVVYQAEGVFEPKETGTADMGEEAKEIYASPSFEITLDQIRGDIQKAYERFGDSLNQKSDI